MFEPKTAVYTPPEVSNYGVQALKKAQVEADLGIPLPIVDIQDYFAPMRPGQLTAVIAQTSNYKSAFLHYWEHAVAEYLGRQGRDEVIIHVSVEEGVEEQAFLEFARVTGEDAGKIARGDVQDWDRLLEAAVVVGGIPIYRVGDSLARAEDMPNLYMSNMVRSIKTLVEGKVTGEPLKPAMLCFDYLQAFPIDPEVKKDRMKDQRRLQVREDIYRLRQAAAYFKCPVVVAVQAKQEMGAGKSPIQLPGIYDGEESSSIAQRCDRVITLWMPKMSHPINTQVSHGGLSFRVSENMLWVKIAKQRGGLPSGKTFRCAINFARNHIAPEVNGLP